MYAENKNIGQNVGTLSNEAIILLKKLIMMLSPISTTGSNPLEIRVEATGSVLMDGIGTIATIGGTIPTVTTISQLGGCGLVTSQSSISVINTTPVDGGQNYSIGDVVTLSGGTNGSVIVNGLYDKSISTINITPISGGIGYVSGEIITIANDNGNGTNGKIRADSVNSSGSIVEASLIVPGYDYYVGNGNQVSSTGSGTGLIVNITSIIKNVGPASSVALYTSGTGYTVGNSIQIGDTVRVPDGFIEFWNDRQSTMSATLVDFKSGYPVSVLTFSQPALVGDVVLIFASGYGAITTYTASDNGVGGSNTYNRIDNAIVADGNTTSINALLASVVYPGTLTITIGTPPTDLGFVAYLIRGVDNYVLSVNHANTGLNPLVTPIQTTNVTSSLFTYWAAETAALVFSSFNLSQATDVYEQLHYHASGHILDIPPGSYTPGANESSATINTGIMGVFLRNTVVAAPGGVTTRPVSTVSSSNGKGLIINIMAVDTGYGNSNYLQSDIGRWLYSDMIRNKLN